jgi:hypothetical protein
MKQDHMDLLSLPVLTILRSRAFFDDVYALSFVLYPIKKSIINLESKQCTLSDCFIGLAQLGAALKNLPDSDHRIFKQQSIAIFNKRFGEFKDNNYLLCFFLHPNHKGL